MQHTQIICSKDTNSPVGRKNAVQHKSVGTRHVWETPEYLFSCMITGKHWPFPEVIPFSSGRSSHYRVGGGVFDHPTHTLTCHPSNDRHSSTKKEPPKTGHANSRPEIQTQTFERPFLERNAGFTDPLGIIRAHPIHHSRIKRIRKHWIVS